MTIAVVILIGMGGLLISSAIDCTPLLQTFQKIISSQAVDWSGAKNCPANTGQATPNAPATIGAGIQGRLINPRPDGTCPAGTTPVFVSNGKKMCELPPTGVK